VVCNTIYLVYYYTSNYNHIVVVNKNYYNDCVFNYNNWRRTDVILSPAYLLGSVPNPIVVLGESYGYYRSYNTDIRFSRL
jgi:hypothetical protein